MVGNPDSGTAPTDVEGYLIDPSEWTEKFAEAAAQSEGIALTDEH